ncbi:hypothetical protein I3760_Q005700 [Carya illinoinensis]|nr:hypothetical protein I3760_Q005700 [Carya illinoinensis]
MPANPPYLSHSPSLPLRMDVMKFGDEPERRPFGLFRVVCPDVFGRRRRLVKNLTKSFRKRRKSTTSSPPLTPPPEPPATTMPPQAQAFRPFLFPQTQSTVLPDPSRFFSPTLLSTPLPTNCFFQNFTLKNGDQPECIHPYLIKSSLSSLSLCYPSCFFNSAFTYQIFNPDLTISASDNTQPDCQKTHIISSFSDLSVTLDFPSSNLRFFLVWGSPFLTCYVSGGTAISISTIHAILSFSSNTALTRYTVKLNNNQTWLIYTSSPISFSQSLSLITSTGFSGIIRIAALPDSDPKQEAILDRFSACYPVSERVGDLLMLAHPLHLRLLAGDGSGVTVLEDFKYKNSWELKPAPVSVNWHSIRAITTTSSYFYGKLIARAARLALIAEEVGFPEVIPTIRKFLKDTIEPWLDGTFSGNGFVYDAKWGGIVTKQGAMDSGADFGFGVYNDHHYHLGYFLYAISVLAKIDPAWGRKYRAHAYSLMADFMNLGRRSNSNYTRLRCFDLYKLHSWAGGLTEFADGRNQESTSEAVNAYYSAALMGLAYGDTHLVAIGSILAAMEIQAAQTWWHVKEGDNMYEEDFTRENRVVGVLWANKRDSGLWFAPPDWRECRLGIQVLPLLPITEVLFSDVGFVRELVNWTLPALKREGVGEGWKGFICALEGIYDKEGALEKTRNLNGYDDGNSLTNLLWWIHSRGDEEERDGREANNTAETCLWDEFFLNFGLKVNLIF